MQEPAPLAEQDEVAAILEQFMPDGVVRHTGMALATGRCRVVMRTPEAVNDDLQNTAVA